MIVDLSQRELEIIFEALDVLEESLIGFEKDSYDKADIKKSERKRELISKLIERMLK